METKSLEEALGNFNSFEYEESKNFKTITLWVPEEYKEKYDRLQKKSERKFSKKLRELILIAIDKTDKVTT